MYSARVLGFSFALVHRVGGAAALVPDDEAGELGIAHFLSGRELVDDGFGDAGFAGAGHYGRLLRLVSDNT